MRMNKVSRRSFVVIVAAVLIMLALILFLVQYAMHASEWVTFPGSPHLYSGVNPSTGVVYDRAGVLLVDSTGTRKYSEDASLRQATIHLLGDRQGYIEAPLLGHFSDKMVGYNAITGLYGSLDHARMATLSIDASVQKTALAALAGRKGTVGVYNFKTGEVLCAVTSPTYDPDQVPDINGDTTGQYEGVYINRFFRSSYTPGSIFKVLTAAAALEQIPDVEDLTFYCEGSTVIGGELITCSGMHGTQDLAAALRNSCNVAFGEISVMLGGGKLEQYVDLAGIRSSLSFDGISTVPGSVNVLDATAPSLAWAGIGQYTDLVNPCQYMVFMGMIANGGTAAQPHLMNEITAGGKQVYAAEPVMLNCGIKASTTEKVAAMMRDNVIFGYGEWMFPGLQVCAKSGTAETGAGKASNALFSGFVMDEQYPLAFIVVIEEGGSGAGAAAPVASQVLAACVTAMDQE